jgi:hypothetical protein
MDRGLGTGLLGWKRGNDIIADGETGIANIDIFEIRI